MDLESLRQLMDERDLRYDQRFQASQQALAAALTAAEKAVSAALTAADRAVTKAEDAANKRFEGLNEMRGMVTDLTATLLTKSEADQRLSAMAEKVDRLERFQATQIGATTKSESTGKTTISIVTVVVSTIISLAAIAVAVISMLSKKAL